MDAPFDPQDSSNLDQAPRVKGPRIVASRLASLIPVAVILAAIAGGTLADAQSPAGPPASASHLLVVPETPEGEAALASSDARVVARYGTFSLVEAAGPDDALLRRAGADRRDDMRTVTTAAGRFDPAKARSSLAGKEAPDRGEALALVQFVGPPKDAWLARLRSTGARLVTYQAENSYVVHAEGRQVDRLAALVGSYAPVRAVAALTAADKLERAPRATGRYAVQTLSGGDGEEARDNAAAAGRSVGRTATVGALRTQYLALSPAEAAELARDPAVVTVEPYGRPELADERGAQIVAGNLSGFAPSGPGYLDWLVDDLRIPNDDTFAFAVDVTDEGLDNGQDPLAHPDFGNRLAYLNNYTGDAEADDCGGHGTNVASIATGYNDGVGPLVEDGAGFNYGLGRRAVRPAGASKIFTVRRRRPPVRTGDTGVDAYVGGARISNNSWGTGDAGGLGHVLDARPAVRRGGA